MGRKRAGGRVDLQCASGHNTWQIDAAILFDSKASGVTVADSEVMHAMKFAVQKLKLLLDPGSATPLASLLAHKVEGGRQPTLIIASGGNVDPQVFSDSLIRAA